MTPEGWTRRRVGDFCERLKRINVDGLDLEPLSITKDRGVILQSEKYNKRIATDPKKYVIAEDGDFAFDPMSLYYGAIGQVRGVGRGLVSPDYVVFKTDGSVHNEFLHMLLRFPEMHQLYESLSETGNSFGKRRRLYWSVFENIELLIPPVTEQEKIAATLSAVNTSIHATEAVIEKLRVVKRAITTDLMMRGQLGLHTKFKTTELGELPESWDVRYVEEFAEICTGSKDTQNRVEGGAYPFIVRSAIPERIDSYSFDGEAVLTAGDGAGTGKIFHYMTGKFDYHQRVYNIHSFKPWVLGKYFYFYFQHYFIDQVRKFSAKNSVDSVRRPMIARMAVPIPPISEQRVIVDGLTSLEHRLLVEESCLERLRGLHSTVMSVLLRGEARVRRDKEGA